MPCSNTVVCVYKHILHVTAHISDGMKKSPIRRAESNREAPLRASLLGLGASGCPLGAQWAPTLHSFFPDTKQTQQHKHVRGWGAVTCVRTWHRETETERQTSKRRKRRRGKKRREPLTHKQNALSFKPQLWAFDGIFFFLCPPLSLSLVKGAITCPGQSHIKQTLVLSPEPDSAKLHCFQMLITNPVSLQPPPLNCSFLSLSIPLFCSFPLYLSIDLPKLPPFPR